MLYISSIFWSNGISAAYATPMAPRICFASEKSHFKAGPITQGNRHPKEGISLPAQTVDVPCPGAVGLARWLKVADDTSPCETMAKKYPSGHMLLAPVSKGM